jgi:hypothetical protein
MNEAIAISEAEGEVSTGGVDEVSQVSEEAVTEAPSSDWRDGLSPDIRNGLGDVGSVEDLAKGYVNAQQMIGGSIRIPGQDAGEGDWEKFYDRFSEVPGLTRYDPNDLTSLYEAAGMPEDIDGYGLEGVDQDFLTLAHAAGLNRDQVETILAYQDLESSDAGEAEEREIEAGVNTLRSEWGLSFDRKVEEGQRAVAFLEQTAPGLSEALDATGAGNHPAMIRLFQALGANLQEGEGFSGTHGASSAITPSEALAQIAEIQNNPKHPYHEGNQEALDKYLELHRFAHPE